jgi:hypothetical protein
MTVVFYEERRCYMRRLRIERLEDRTLLAVDPWSIPSLWDVAELSRLPGSQGEVPYDQIAEETWQQVLDLPTEGTIAVDAPEDLTDTELSTWVVKNALMGYLGASTQRYGWHVVMVGGFEPAVCRLAA